MKIPETTLNQGRQVQASGLHSLKNAHKSQFRTMVVINDDRIHVEGEGAPNVVGLFKGNYQEVSSMNRYDCDLADLSVIILQQVWECSI